MQGILKLSVFLFLWSPLVVRSQVKFHLLGNSHLEFVGNNDFKWWEWRINNNSCDSLNYSIQLSLIDSLSLGFHLYYNNKKINDSSFLVLPNSQDYMKLFCENYTLSNQDLEVTFKSKSGEKDTCFTVTSSVVPRNEIQSRVFPRESSGIFKIYHADFSNAQVLVMDHTRNIVLEDRNKNIFLDLSTFEKGPYIVQMEDQEYIIYKD